MYRGCYIIDMGDSYVCTNRFGTTIGQAKSTYDCEDIIDTYLDNSETQSNTSTEQNFMKLVESVKDCIDYFHFHNANLTRAQDEALYRLEEAYNRIKTM